MLRFKVNAQKCTKCNLCVRDCPAGIIKREKDKLPAIAPSDEAECMQCQHCLAICPTAAISILGRDPRNSQPLLPGNRRQFLALARLVRGRRSFRQYRDTNVDPRLLKELLGTLANVPTGVNRRGLTFTVIDDKVVMQRFRLKFLAALARAVKTKRLAPDFFLSDAPALYADDGTDYILRGAPHLLVVSAPPDAPCPHEDVTLALAYFELLAQSAGLGTVWCGLLKMGLEALPRLKGLLGLPAKHIYYTMLFGLPRIRYRRTVQRDDAAVVKRVRL